MRHLPLIAALALGPALGAPRVARAHGPAPSVLGVLTTDDEGRPGLLRTNVGLVQRQRDGTYAHVCPSQWGGLETAFAAALPDASLVGAIAYGRLYLSVDGACSFAEVALPEPWLASSIEAFDGRLWVLARAGAGEIAGDALLAVDRTRRVEHVQRFDDGVSILDVRAGPAGRAERLWAVAAEPTPALFVAEREAPARWRRLGGLPEDPPAWLELRGTSTDTVWLEATVEASRELWRVVLGADGAAATVQRVGPFARAHGPERLAGTWLAVLDGQLAAWDARAAAWQNRRGVSWTCLAARGARLYACDLGALHELTARPEGAVDERLAFDFVQIGPPRPGCPPDEPAAMACETDWVHFGGEAGWLETTPATSPDGERAPGPPPERGGCSVAGGTASAPWLGLAPALLALRRRRRLDRGKP